MPFHAPHPCRLFIFDLDGTLIDSKLDIARAVNLSLRRMQLPAIPVSRIMEFVGEGARKLIQRSLREATGTEPGNSQLDQAVSLYFEEYGNHLLDSTSLYPGVPEVLDHLWWALFAVVSNKPEAFSRRILSGLGLEKRFCVILGGDSTCQRKPDPKPLLDVMGYCNAQPSETAMVGDSPVDIIAGKAAGVITCGVSGGYRGTEELAAAGCDLIIPGVSELAHYFCIPESVH